MAGTSLPAPKILLAKPGLSTSRRVDDEDAAILRSRLPSIASLNLLSESWDFHIDRFLPFLTDTTDFTVVGVIGPPGVGKSTIMNELYGFDPTSPGMLPPFAIESEETRVMAKHCTVGIEPRVSSERIILLDTQPIFSPSVLAEMIRPDGFSTISLISGESLSAELAHELMSIQVGVLLASICHIILVVSEGFHDASMWRLMSTVDLLKHGIPDPSSISLTHQQISTLNAERENVITESWGEYMAVPIFVHTKLQDQDLSRANFEQVKNALAQYFRSSSFHRSISRNASKEDASLENQADSALPKLFFIPYKGKDDYLKPQYESYESALWKLRDQVMSMNCPSFSRALSERDWLKNSAKIWDFVKSSPILADYCRALKSSGLFRK